MKYELNGLRRVVKHAGDIWEVDESDNYNWHLIRQGVTISLPRLITGWIGQCPVEEDFSQFVKRLSKIDSEFAQKQ